MFCRCLCCIEAVSGRLIDPKSWDQIDIILWNPNVQPVTVGVVWGFYFIKIALNHVLMCRRPDMAVEISFK